MKRICSSLTLIGLVLINAEGQELTSSAAQRTTVKSSTNETPYVVIERGANHRVWAKWRYETLPSGQVISNAHKVVELATGLHFKRGEQWQESKEVIKPSLQGGAEAVQGQHQVRFPYDIYEGGLQTVTPDGQVLNSQPIGIAYCDGTNSIMIAELTNSVGQILPNRRQVVYTNAFTGFEADLICTYKKSGFESDLVFRQRPPSPSEYGLDPIRTRVQLWTEFFDSPEPLQEPAAKASEEGLQDVTLTFGRLKMIPGRAFMIGAVQNGAITNVHARVFKRWVHVDGRTFLVEELPVRAIKAQLQALHASVPTKPGSLVAAASAVGKGQNGLLLPVKRLAKPGDWPMQLAAANDDRAGLVLDYATVVSFDAPVTVFQANTTYFVSGPTYVDGATIEGGTVIKYPNDTEAYIDGELNCQTGPYRPAVFTAADDDTVGETTQGVWRGHTGTVSGYYANPALRTAGQLHDLRFRYAQQAISAYWAAEVNLADSQIYNCNYGVGLEWNYGVATLQNCLIVTPSGAFIGGGLDAAFNLYFCTVDNSARLVGLGTDGSSAGAVYAVNSIFSNIGDLGSGTLTGGYNGFYNTPGSFGDNPIVADSNLQRYEIFDSNWYFSYNYGNYYLLGSPSAFSQQGTSDASYIADSAILADIESKTTHIPQILSEYGSSMGLSLGNMTLGQATFGDTSSTPDLGYHYDRLDYVAGDNNGGEFVNGHLTFGPGTVVGWSTTHSTWDEVGLYLEPGALVTLSGTAEAPCYLIPCNMVWEQDPGAKGSAMVSVSSAAAPTINANFTHFSAMNFTPSFFNTPPGGRFALNATNSEFWNAGIYGNYSGLSINLFNCLLNESAVALLTTLGAAPCQVTITNCTLLGSTLNFGRLDPNDPWPISVANCAMDSMVLISDSFNSPHSNLYFDYNAYPSGAFLMPAVRAVAGPNNFQVPTFDWQPGSLGKYYLPSNSRLIDHGNKYAGQMGMYHFTTQAALTSKEATSILDIGYHYVALNASGKPLDSNGDGNPDYMDEDSDGNGLPDAWELNYFGVIGVAADDQDCSGSGYSFAQDFAYDIPPTVMGFYGIDVLSDIVSSSSVSAQLEVVGYPYFIAILVDDENFDDADWKKYLSASVELNVGVTEGWHDVWIGLRGFADSPSAATWQWRRIKIDHTSPSLVITGPTQDAIDIPVIQLTGYSSENLDSISYEISNSSGVSKNQKIYITDRTFEPNAWEFTTTTFKGYDIRLSPGLNTITLQATDVAGNVATISRSYNLDYSHKTSPPVVQVIWPPDGTLVAGDKFTLDGQLADPTATVSASINGADGEPIVIPGLVERTGRFWVQNIPLSAGPNTVVLTAVDVVGNTTVITNSVVQSSFELTLAPVDAPEDLWNSTISVKGTISDPTYAVWVNGKKGRNNRDGTWAAENVPVDTGGTASFTVTAYSPDETQPDGSHGN